jgi:hypothetical protein
MPRGFLSPIVAAAGVASSILFATWPAGLVAQGTPSIAGALLRDLTWRPIGPLGTGAVASSGEGRADLTFASARTDTAFPYRVCGGQMNTGSVCVASRGGPGQGLVRDWEPLGLAGMVAPDPADPDVIYGALPSGRLGRFDRRTGQTQDVSPPSRARFRAGPGSPILFSPTDSRTLYFAADTLWRTANGGVNWAEISPGFAGERGVISTLAPSPVDARVIWAGTDTGVIQVTRDAGTTWRDVTPSAVAPQAAISRLAASHFDTGTAYAVVNARRDGDPRPNLHRTRDGGVTWVEVAAGLPPDEPVHAVQEDALRRGLLFAATGRAVYVSFDDGDRWQSLQQNMPASPVRDLTIKDSDLVIATSGRGFWILDDISPLRQITPDVARADAFLFRPAITWRTQRMRAPGAAIAPDADALPQAPDGVALAYLIGAGVSGAVTLEIIETTTGEVIRRFSSAAATAPTADAVGAASDLRLDASAGLHRVVWDLRYDPPPLPPPASGAGQPRPGETGAGLHGAFVLPGTYQVRLTVGARALRQAVVVRMDPRVRASIVDLTLQYKLSRALDEALRQIAATRLELGRRQAGSTGETAARLQAIALSLDEAWRNLAARFDTLQTPAIEAAAIEAIARAATAVASTRDGG